MPWSFRQWRATHPEGVDSAHRRLSDGVVHAEDAPLAELSQWDHLVMLEVLNCRRGARIQGMAQ
jgi:hypothetical protein